MKHAVPHGLDADLAKRAVDQALQSYAQRFSEYQPKVSWPSAQRASIQFSVKGITLKGAVDLRPKSIDLDLNVPFVLRVFKKKAIAVIEREIQTWLDKAERGELDED